MVERVRLGTTSLRLEDIHEPSRKLFEDRAFNQRFLMSIRRVRASGPCALVPVGCPTMVEFLARDEEGRYLDETLNAMWWAWCESRGWARDY